MSNEILEISEESKQDATSEENVLPMDHESAFMRFVSSYLIRIENYDTDILIRGLMEVFEDLSYSKRKVYNLLLEKCGSSIDIRVNDHSFIIKKIMELYEELHYDQNTVQYLLYQKWDICIKCRRKCWNKNEICSNHGCQFKTCFCCCSVNDMEDNNSDDNTNNNDKTDESAAEWQ